MDLICLHYRRLTIQLTGDVIVSCFKGGMRHWEEPTKKEKKRDDWFYSPYHQARSADIEMTAYGLLSMIPDQDQNKALASIDIVKWLSQQRNSLGGWSSTQVCEKSNSYNILNMQLFIRACSLLMYTENGTKQLGSFNGLIFFAFTCVLKKWLTHLFSTTRRHIFPGGLEMKNLGVVV